MFKATFQIHLILFGVIIFTKDIYARMLLLKPDILLQHTPESPKVYDTLTLTGTFTLPYSTDVEYFAFDTQKTTLFQYKDSSSSEWQNLTCITFTPDYGDSPKDSDTAKVECTYEPQKSELISFRINFIENEFFSAAESNTDTFYIEKHPTPEITLTSSIPDSKDVVVGTQISFSATMSPAIPGEFKFQYSDSDGTGTWRNIICVTRPTHVMTKSNKQTASHKKKSTITHHKNINSNTESNDCLSSGTLGTGTSASPEIPAGSYKFRANFIPKDQIRYQETPSDPIEAKITKQIPPAIDFCRVPINLPSNNFFVGDTIILIAKGGFVKNLPPPVKNFEFTKNSEILACNSDYQRFNSSKKIKLNKTKSIQNKKAVNIKNIAECDAGIPNQTYNWQINTCSYKILEEDQNTTLNFGVKYPGDSFFEASATEKIIEQPVQPNRKLTLTIQSSATSVRVGDEITLIADFDVGSGSIDDLKISYANTIFTVDGQDITCDVPPPPELPGYPDEPAEPAKSNESQRARLVCNFYAGQANTPNEYIDKKYSVRYTARDDEGAKIPYFIETHSQDPIQIRVYKYPLTLNFRYLNLDSIGKDGRGNYLGDEIELITQLSGFRQDGFPTLHVSADDTKPDVVYYRCTEPNCTIAGPDCQRSFTQDRDICKFRINESIQFKYRAKVSSNQYYYIADETTEEISLPFDATPINSIKPAVTLVSPSPASISQSETTIVLNGESDIETEFTGKFKFKVSGKWGDNDLSQIPPLTFTMNVSAEEGLIPSYKSINSKNCTEYFINSQNPNEKYFQCDLLYPPNLNSKLNITLQPRDLVPLLTECLSDDGCTEIFYYALPQHVPKGAPYCPIRRLDPHDNPRCLSLEKVDYVIPISIKSNITKRDIFTDQESKRTGIGCGERGNVYDRVFDCALRIKDSYGKAKYTGGDLQNRQSYKFGKDPTDSRDSMWFLANCPRNARVYQCAWLSPELVAHDQYGNWNPAMDYNDFAPFPFNETEKGPDMGRYAKKRMLWSGMLLDRGSILYEKFWDVNIYRGDEYNGPQYNEYDGFGLIRHLKPDTRVWWHKQDIRDKNKKYDICSQKSGVRDSAGVWLPQNLNFRVPTYPQIELLTGPPQCNGINGNTQPYICADYRRNGQIFGLGASIVPGFYNIDDHTKWLWSSSWFHICYYTFFTCHKWARHAWAFNLETGIVIDRDEPDPNAVRCVTMDVDEIPEY